tara:strand:+ start:195 stop:653 length:459 start_codon:yes stop_codon:yes gene_type:complete
MPVTSLFSLFRAKGWGRQSEQQIDVLYLAASSRVTATVTPSDPYQAMVVHFITLNHMLPNAFTVTVSQKEVGTHTVVASADLSEVSFWAWVTDADPLLITVINRTAFNSFVGMTLATILFDNLKDMQRVRSTVEREPLAKYDSYGLMPGSAG